MWRATRTFAQTDGEESVLEQIEEALLQPLRARLRQRCGPVGSRRRPLNADQEGAILKPGWPRRAAWSVIRALTSRWALFAAILVALALFVRPEVLVRQARDDARACLAKTRAPRGPELPNCAPIVREFDLATDFSYTRHDATYRAEELLARVGMDRYVDAAVGNPNVDRLADAAVGVMRMQALLENGSRRISLEDLGPTVPAPHLGKLASSLGDRRALLEHQDSFDLWYLRRDVIEAALLEADFEQAADAALNYHDSNPTEADLRTTLGALLCIVSPIEGYELLQTVPAARSEKRYANIQRNYGEMFAVLESCAWKVGADEPSLPEDNNAGDADAPEVRFLTKLRKSAPGPDRKRRVATATDLLRGESSQKLDPKVPYARAMILAAVLSLGDEPLGAAALVKLATPLADVGEPPLGPKDLSLRTILEGGPGLQPIVSTSMLAAAANKYEAAAKAASAGASREALERAAAGLHTVAALELANAGEAPSAIVHAKAGARLQRLSPRATALSVASVAYVAGDAGKARAQLDAAPASERGEPRTIELGFVTLQTLLTARDDMPAAKTLASKLWALAAEADSPELSLDAQWLAVALARETVARDHAGLQSTGQADNLNRYRDRGAPPISSTLAAWANALDADGPTRRAFRFALLDHRGDMPASGLGQLFAAGLLLDDDAPGSAEIWLDAFTAFDSRRLRLRSYAWLRMEAARFRGDAQFEELWSQRLAVLRGVASEEADLEATRFLRF